MLTLLNGAVVILTYIGEQNHAQDLFLTIKINVRSKLNLCCGPKPGHVLLKVDLDSFRQVRTLSALEAVHVRVHVQVQMLLAQLGLRSSACAY